MARKRGQEVLAVGQKVVVIDPCEDAARWIEGATGTDNLAVTTANRAGRYAIEFDKIAGGATAFLTQKLPEAISLGDRAQIAKVELQLTISDLTDVASVSVDIGTDVSNYITLTWLDSVLSTGYQAISKRITEQTGADVGRGINTDDIRWIRMRVVFDAAGDTLADMAIDQLVFVFEETEEVTVSGTVDVDPVANTIGLATGAKQDTAKTVLDGIKTGTDKIPASPATEGKQDNAITQLTTIAGKDFATAGKQDSAKTVLDSILVGTNKIPAAPSTEGKQDTGNTSLATLAGTVASGRQKAELYLGSVQWTRSGAAGSGPPVTIVAQDATAIGHTTGKLHVHDSISKTVLDTIEGKATFSEAHLNQINAGLGTHDTPFPSRAFQMGARYRVTPVAVGDGDITAALADAYGRLKVMLDTTTDFATQTTLALIKAKTDNIPSDPSKESGKLTDIETNTDALAGVTKTDVGGSKNGLDTHPMVDIDTLDTYKYPKSNVAIVDGTVARAAPGAGKRIAVIGIFAAAWAAQDFVVEDEDDNSFRDFPLAANAHVVETGTADAPLFVLPTNKAMHAQTLNAVDHSFFITSVVIDA